MGCGASSAAGAAEAPGPPDLHPDHADDVAAAGTADRAAPAVLPSPASALQVESLALHEALEGSSSEDDGGGGDRASRVGGRVGRAVEAAAVANAADDGADGTPLSLDTVAAAKEAKAKRKRAKAEKKEKLLRDKNAGEAGAGEAPDSSAPGATLVEVAPAGVSALAVLGKTSKHSKAKRAAAAQLERDGSQGSVLQDGGKGAAAKSTPRAKAISPQADYQFHAIEDTYESLDEVSDALRAAGLESSNLIVAIDFTKSNTWTGRDTFGGRSLHDVRTGLEDNPYVVAIRTIGTVLAPYDDDNLIPVFGFGDSTTTDKSVFPFFPDRPARGFEEVLQRYRELVPRVVMAGPTNFAPAIEAAIQICIRERSYHILVIIADGQVTNRAHTEAAIVRASAYPLSIVLVGVGDGPWDMMEDFDDSLPQRRFDNFQFVCLTEIAEAHPANAEIAFALACLMEIPEQYRAIRSLRLI